jgi:DNA-binding response OmpR family regulator
VRVLVVSEDATERLRAVSALRLHAAAEVDVVEAESGPRALEALRGEAFDVLVVDGDLFPRGGFALLYTLRSQADLQDATSPPAVILAGRDQDR